MKCVLFSTLAIAMVASCVAGNSSCLAELSEDHLALVQRQASLAFKGQKKKKKVSECQHDREQALANYRAGNANLWFYHITHHGGTTLFELAQKNGLTDVSDDVLNPNWPIDPKAIHMWGETMSPDAMMGQIRDHLAWQIDTNSDTTSLASVLPCNSDNFVSMIVMREPMSRMLANDGPCTPMPCGMYDQDHPGLFTINATNYMDQCGADNYGLRWLSGNRYLELTRDDLQLAKDRLDMFDFVIMFEDLAFGSQKLCTELGWTCPVVTQLEHKQPADILPANVLADLQERNRLDAELYEYAVSKAKAQGMLGSATSQVIALHNTGVKHVMAMASETEQRWVCSK